MPRIAAIRVHNDLAARKAGIAVRPTDDKAARWVDKDARVCIHQSFRDNGADYFSNHGITDGFLRHIRIVLRADNDRIHTHGCIPFIFHAHLCLAIRAEEGKRAALAHRAELARKRMGEIDRERHVFRGFIAGIAKHHALIARAGRKIRRFAGLGFKGTVHAHGDVRGLLAERHEHGTGFAVKAVSGVIIPDVADDAAHKCGNIQHSVRGDFTHHKRKAGRYAAFAGNAGLWVFREAGIQHRIGKLVTNFVRMSVRHGFRGK